MPRAWDDRQRGGGHPERWDGAPAGAPAEEELAHEMALAAALDRSRRDLSPDPHASARMRDRLFEVLAREGVGGGTPAPARPGPFGAPGGYAPVDQADLTAPIGPPIGEDLDHRAASNRRSAGEHTPDAGEQAVPARTRRGRHVLPAEHPDHPSGVTAEDRSGPGRDDDGRPGPRPLDRRRPSVRKRFGVVVGGFAALAVVAGVTSTLSRDALPGDAMYGVKRAGESVGGMFAFGDQAEAARQLDLARSRVDEVESLLARGGPPSPDAIAGALDDFDRATSTGSRLMLTGAGAEGADPARLSELRTWAAAQSGRLTGLSEQLPAESRPDAVEAIRLLDRVLARAEALRASSGCAGEAGGSVDDLGPLPVDCPTGAPSSDAVRQSGSFTPVPPSTSSEVGTPETGSSSSSPQTPGSETPPALPGAPLPDGGLPLVGEAPTGAEPTGTGTETPEPGGSGGLLPPITIPPLLPGVGPVTIG